MKTKILIIILVLAALIMITCIAYAGLEDPIKIFIPFVQSPEQIYDCTCVPLEICCR